MNGFLEVPLRYIAHKNGGVASGVARALLSYFYEYIPLPFYHDNQIRFRNSHQELSVIPQYLGEESKIKIYPNPSNSEVFIEWEESDFKCVSLSVFNFYGQRESHITGELKSPFLLKTDQYSKGIHWMVVQDNNGRRISGQVVLL